MNSRKLLLVSNSSQHGYQYLQHVEQSVQQFFKGSQNILFVPFALKDHDEYEAKAKNAFEKMGLPLKSLHHADNAKKAIEECDGMFVGGGNTFRLLRKMYELDVLDLIRKRVFQGELRYMGTSAGTNIATNSIKTTNDMPIVHVQSFDALKLVPFQINAHFVDADLSSTHKGETREKRIEEFHEENDTAVVGLREGAFLEVNGDKAILGGLPGKGGKLFEKGKDPQELKVGQKVDFLLQEKSTSIF